MAYIIKIRGEEEGISVNDLQGQKLLLAWEEYHKTKKNIPIEINGYHGTISDIRNILFEKNVKKVSDLEVNDYTKEHADIRKLPIKDKATRSGFLKLVHYTFTGKKLEDENIELKKKLVDVQIKFFTNNPKRIYPDLILFKEIYGDVHKYDVRSMYVLENLIRRDHRESTFV
jgi:hypothetical protein